MVLGRRGVAVDVTKEKECCARHDDKRCNKRAGQALLSLSAAAMALPALAVNQPSETVVALKSSYYEEDPIRSSDEVVIFGDPNRYKIKVNQCYLLKPLGSNWALTVDYANESMSGASPWGAVADEEGNQQLIMSGASIDDSRNKVEGTVTRYMPDSALSLTVGGSREHDYRSDYLGLAFIQEFNLKNTTLSVDASYASDELSPTDAVQFGRIERADKSSRSLAVAISQILSRSQVAQVGYGVTKRSGFLADPYKLRDVRPGERLEHRLSIGYLRYFEAWSARLKAEYRYFWDSFDISAHTTSVSFFKSLGRGWDLEPRLRWYEQSEASFFTMADRYDLPLTASQSSDARLSSFGAWSAGLSLNYSTDVMRAGLSYDRYVSEPSAGIGAPSRHRALMRYELLSLGVRFKL